MFTLPALPYAYDALSPVVSDRTLQFHHDKHHAAYVNALNGFRADAADKDATLEAVIAESAGASDRRIFNNAAQAWNHAFFWISMTPTAQPPAGVLAEAITRDFGGLDALKTAFVNAGVGHFGSGWVWLAVDGQGKLSVPSTHDAANLLGEHGLTPLLVCDLWEHAYYLDHQNDRKGFLGAWFDSLANWSFAAEQLAAAHGGGATWSYPAPVAG